ncbi:hypothetical protein IE53DRAFT_389937 [Violaceomyces palustris]|uniref:Uncharacterized protein n=1 Tax=Violaceomyces palustris TaxID=1673888 RepID=A0ACD0NQ49_9BASI|nr:hypothetical protein IE53DRAFT_389937 [Violaceomyces palustris]
MEDGRPLSISSFSSFHLSSDACFPHHPVPSSNLRTRAGWHLLSPLLSPTVGSCYHFLPIRPPPHHFIPSFSLRLALDPSRTCMPFVHPCTSLATRSRPPTQSTSFDSNPSTATRMRSRLIRSRVHLISQSMRKERKEGPQRIQIRIPTRIRLSTIHQNHDADRRADHEMKEGPFKSQTWPCLNSVEKGRKGAQV